VIADLFVVLPEHAASTPFGAELAEGRLVVQRCGACGSVQHPPRVVCTTCSRSDVLAFVPTPGRGVVYAVTTVRRSLVPELADSIPYAMAIVELEEGARMVGLLGADGASHITIGAPVRAVIERNPAGRPLVVFRSDGVGADGSSPLPS
jgi:uncharacterized protein